MSKVTKWIFGIVIGLLIVAVIGGVVFLAVSRWGSFHGMMDVRSLRSWDDTREVPRFNMPMHPGGWMNSRWFGGFSLLRMLFGGLFWIGLITLSVIGVVSLLQRRKVTQQQPAIAAAPTVQAPASELNPVQPRTCANCAHVVQDDWSHCPYCGNTLT